MRKQTMIVLALSFAIGIILTGIASSGDRGKPTVKYPDDYRHWTHVKSMVIQPGDPLYEAFGGIHHIYANWKAFKAMRDGKPFPDGAVLIFDLLEMKKEHNSLVEGARKLIAVVQKDSKGFMDTGGGGSRSSREIPKKGSFSRRRVLVLTVTKLRSKKITCLVPIASNRKQ